MAGYDLEPVTERSTGVREVTEADVRALDEFDELTVERRGDGVVAVESTRHVGVVGLPSGGRLEVAPKVDCDFLYLLAFAGDVAETLVRDAEVGWAAGPSFVDELATLYASELGRLLDRGVHREYRTEAGEHDRVRGRLDLQRQLRKPGPAHTSFSCRTRRRTAATTANRALLQAAVTLLGATDRTSAVRALRHHARELRRVVPYEPVSIQALDAVRTNRLNDYYRTPLRLARQVVAGRGVDPLRAPGDSYESLLVNVEHTFETVVVAAVSSALAAGERVTDGRLGPLLDGERHGTVQTLEPDVVVESRDGDVTLVGDAKWKAGIGTPARGDLYQMAAYQRHAGAPGLLVYPGQDGDPDDAYAYRGAAADEPGLVVSTLPISGHDSFEAFEDAVRECAAAAVERART